MFFYLNYFLHTSYIPSPCHIGKTSKFAFGGIGLVIHDNARIGEGVSLVRVSRLAAELGFKQFQ